MGVASEPGEPDDIGLGTPGLPAGSEGVPHEALGTGADCAVVPGLALRVLATGVLTRRPAVVVETSLVKATFTVVDTLSS